MEQYEKLFDKSEIEYITPFLKLWMSFNNWYKKNLEKVNTDREAIDEYKKYGDIKNEFIRLLNGKSDEDVKFQNALASFVKLIQECSFDKSQYPKNLFNRNPSEDTIKSQSLIPISTQNKEFYYSDTDGERLYENTIELIYQVRCKLVHGDFDIDNQNFINLVENSYKMFYPIMNNILQNQENQLVHGDFDIGNQNFINLVENSYKMFYPIMNNILQNQENQNVPNINHQKK